MTSSSELIGEYTESLLSTSIAAAAEVAIATCWAVDIAAIDVAKIEQRLGAWIAAGLSAIARAAAGVIEFFISQHNKCIGQESYAYLLALAT